MVTPNCPEDDIRALLNMSQQVPHFQSSIYTRNPYEALVMDHDGRDVDFRGFPNNINNNNNHQNSNNKKGKRTLEEKEQDEDSSSLSQNIKKQRSMSQHVGESSASGADSATQVLFHSQTNNPNFSLPDLDKEREKEGSYSSDNKSFIFKSSNEFYSNRDTGPFVIHIQVIDPQKVGLANLFVDSNQPPPPSSNKTPYPALHPVMLGKTLAQLFPRLHYSIHPVSKNKFEAHFESSNSANYVVSQSARLKEHNLKAFIPEKLRTCIGLIKDVPLDLDLRDIAENLLVSVPGYDILSVRREKRRVTQNPPSNENDPNGNPSNQNQKSEWVDSKTISIKFQSQHLPRYIYLYRVRHEVTQFFPKVRICNNCFRPGHLAPYCKSMSICFKCGKEKDNDDNPHKDCSVAFDAKPSCVRCEKDRKKRESESNIDPETTPVDHEVNKENKNGHWLSSRKCPFYRNYNLASRLAITQRIPIKQAMFIIENKMSNQMGNEQQQPPNINDLPSFPRLPSKGNTKGVPDREVYNTADHNYHNSFANKVKKGPSSVLPYRPSNLPQVTPKTTPPNRQNRNGSNTQHSNNLSKIHESRTRQSKQKTQVRSSSVSRIHASTSHSPARKDPPSSFFPSRVSKENSQISSAKKNENILSPQNNSKPKPKPKSSLEQNSVSSPQTPHLNSNGGSQ